MSNKIYAKRGNKTSEEKRYIKELEKFFSKNPHDEPVEPVKNYTQLKKLYEKHCTETVEFEETPRSKEDEELDRILAEQEKQKTSGSALDEKEETDIDDSTLNDRDYDSDSGIDKNDYIDPFNKEEPIIRDHVTSQSFSKDDSSNQQADSRTSFSEPSNFKDSFDIPGGDNKTEGSNSTTQQNQKQKTEPINPAWNDMDASRKRRSTKRFAKYIVEFVCLCAEKGFIWYSDKNIDTNVAILKDEFDLSVMVSLDATQQITVIQFFELQKIEAQQLAKIEKDDMDELIDALAAWMMEKGFAPSAIQELSIVALSVFGKQALLLMAHVSKTNSIVSQLRSERQGNPTEDQKHEEVKEPTSIKEELKEPVVEEPVSKKTKGKKTDEAEEGDYTKMKEIGAATKE